MKFTFIGTGSAFTTDNWQSNVLVESNGDTINQPSTLLIDCGGDARHALKEIGKTYFDIDAVYISHLHNDHIGGMEWLGFCRYFDPRTSRPIVYVSKYLKDDLWSALKPGMCSLQGEMADMNTYFDVKSIGKNKGFEWSGANFQLVQTIHVVDGYHFMFSFGLIIKIHDKTVYFTADTQHCPNQIMDFYKMSDFIFQDCEIGDRISGVHANYKELVTLPDDIKSKMWLYHYQPGSRPDAIADGFAGFIEKGQSFIF